LSSAYDCIIPSRGLNIVKTDLAVSIPINTYARIAPRSGLTVKNCIDVGAGVVDYDYRGNVGVVLFNHSDKDFEVKRGDRIAQLIIQKILNAQVVSNETELSQTDRGMAGFGSTGVAASEITPSSKHPAEENEKVDQLSPKRSKIEKESIIYIFTIQ
jgi:dUTP pyrophosphatase